MKLPIGCQFEHVLASFKDVDGRVKPGHDEKATGLSERQHVLQGRPVHGSLPLGPGLDGCSNRPCPCRL
jgi:hypothetical protein